MQSVPITNNVVRVSVVVFNATFNNISAISLRVMQEGLEVSEVHVATL